MLLWTLRCTYLFELAFLLFFSYILRSRIAESYGSSVFSFPRNPQSFFSGCTNLHSYQQHAKFPFPLHPGQHLLLVLLLSIFSWFFCAFCNQVLCFLLWSCMNYYSFTCSHPVFPVPLVEVFSPLYILATLVVG